jgi:hypothetical protein
MDTDTEARRAVEYTEDEAFAVVRWLNADLGTPEYHARTAQLGMSPARAEAIRADLAASGRFLSRSGHGPTPAHPAPPVGLQSTYA